MNTIKNIKEIKYNTLQKELVRKGIHMTISFVPLLANINKNFTISILLIGSSFYLISEILRVNNKKLIGFVTSISEIASRERDKGITLGPLTLAIGSIITLMIFSNTAAFCGIFALAFGDGLSSITGKFWGKIKIPFTGGKSIIGFFTCFTMILSTSYGVTGSLNKALVAALGGSLIELVPIKDIDNILIPLTVAFLISI